jgi:hypothetical protein
MADDDRITAWLIDEARDSGHRIAEIMGVDEKVLATGVTVIGIAASVAVAQGKAYLLMVVPAALASLFCFIAYRYSEAFAVSGYKAVLERAIRQRLGGVPVIAWESELAESRHSSAPTRFLFGVLCALYIGSSVLAISQSLATRRSHHWGHANSALFISLTSISIIGGAALAYVALTKALGERLLAEKIAQDRLFNAWTGDSAT